MRIFLLFSVLLLSACGEDRKPTVADSHIGENISTLIFQDLTGEAVSLESKAGGKPVVLNIWATWCPPCVKELPYLADLHKSGEFYVVAVSTDRAAETITNFLEAHKLTDLPVLWDPLGKISRNEISATQLPITYILDASLTIKGIEAGEREWNHPQMVEKIKNMLGNGG